MASSRVIVKNLPKQASEARLREFFSATGEVTDCRLKTTQDGISRQFAFVGYRNQADAQAAVKQLHRTYFDTSKVIVELAHAPGAEALSRPWSRHAFGSTAHRKQHPEAYGDAAKAPGSAPSKAKVDGGSGRKARAKVVAAPGASSVKMAAVKATKAGVKEHRVHTQFASSDEENDATDVPAAKDRAGEAAFDDGLSDLAYLQAKSAASVDDGATLTDDNTPKKRKKTRKAKAKEAAEASLPGTEALGAGETIASSDIRGDTLTAAAAEDAANAQSAAFRGGEGVARRALAAADRDELESHGRLYVTNLPYGATEEELRAHFEPLGEISAVVICKDEDTSKSRGFGYVSYVFPECALRALSEMDLASFQGRLLRVATAKAKAAPVVDESAGSAGGSKASGSSYKRQKEQQRKKVDAHLEHTWNLLYVSANAAADTVAGQLNVSKAELFGKDAENAAVSVALTETSVIQQTKTWLQREGIRVEAFEQKGASLANCKSAADADAGRQDDSFIVKHLPAGASGEELRERFARYGELAKFSLAPSGTVAIVQYADKGHALRAFQKLAFSRYRHVPLYLEWAPAGAFVEPTAGSEATADRQADEDDAEAGDEDRPQGCLFVKNLSFATTDAGLKAAFARCKGFRSAVVMKKKTAKSAGQQQQEQSMGYGFLEFTSPAAAAETLRQRQGLMVDGHALQLQVSQRSAQRKAHGDGSENSAKKGAKGVSSPRLCVRNLAFEANRKELAQLFGAYGNVTSVRIPKKSDYSGHRGFAFIDFASKTEAAGAYEALQHTHLYGRAMVIEPAEEKATDVGTVQETTKKRMASKQLNSEAKKRRLSGLLHAAGDAGSFKDALT